MKTPVKCDRWWEIIGVAAFTLAVLFVLGAFGINAASAHGDPVDSDEGYGPYVVESEVATAEISGTDRQCLGYETIGGGEVTAQVTEPVAQTPLTQATSTLHSGELCYEVNWLVKVFAKVKIWIKE